MEGSGQLVVRAIRLAGSAERVRQTLDVTPAHLDALRAGRRKPTEHQFHVLVLLILREQERLIDRNRELLSRLKAC